MKKLFCLLVCCLSLVGCDTSEEQPSTQAPIAVTALEPHDQPGAPSQQHTFTKPFDDSIWNMTFEVMASGRTAIPATHRSRGLDPTVYRYALPCREKDSDIGKLTALYPLPAPFGSGSHCSGRVTGDGELLVLEVGTRPTYREDYRWKKVGKFPSDTMAIGVVGDIILTRDLSKQIYRGHDLDGKLLWERSFEDAEVVRMVWSDSGALNAELTVSDGGTFRQDRQAIDPRDGKSVRAITLDPTLSRVVMAPEETLRHLAKQRAERAKNTEAREYRVVDQFEAGEFEVTLTANGLLELDIRRIDNDEPVVDSYLNQGKVWSADIFGGVIEGHIVIMRTLHRRAPEGLIPLDGRIHMNVYDLTTGEELGVWSYMFSSDEERAYELTSNVLLDHKAYGASPDAR